MPENWGQPEQWKGRASNRRSRQSAAAVQPANELRYWAREAYSPHCGSPRAGWSGDRLGQADPGRRFTRPPGSVVSAAAGGHVAVDRSRKAASRAVSKSMMAATRAAGARER